MSSNSHSCLRNGTALLGALVGFAAVTSAASADVTISSNVTENMNCSGGVCAPTADSAVLNVSDLEALLASGNVEVTSTGSGGVQAANIDVKAALTWSNGSLLTLNAADAIEVAQSVSATSSGGLSLSSSSRAFVPGSGNVTFENLSSALSINGTSYTLVNSLAGLAANIGFPVALAQSYDASGDGTYTTSPIQNVPSYGIVEGLGNTISNLTINDTNAADEDVGMIGGVDGGIVRDIGVVNANVSANSEYGGYDGALAGVLIAG